MTRDQRQPPSLELGEGAGPHPDADPRTAPMPRTRRDDYTAAALELLDRHGPATQTLGVTAAEVCAITGTHRSTLYRHFETVAELNDEIAVWLAAGLGDWRAEIGEHDPSDPLRAVLLRSIPDPTDEVSPWIRGVIASWSDDHPARRRTIEVERARQVVLVRWLGEHLSRHGLRPAGTTSLEAIALGVAALVEGHGMLRLVDAPAPTGWSERERLELIERIVQLVADLVEPGRRIDEPAGPLPRSAELEPQLLPVTIARFQRVGPQVLRHRPTPLRLVHLGRLARRLGVQERRLYAMWPHADDMNADIAAAAIGRERERLDALLGQVFETGDHDEFEGFHPLLASCARRAIVGSGVERRTTFALMGSHLTPEQRLRLASLLDGWTADLRTAFLASQALLRMYRRPGISPASLTRALRASFFGLQRLSLSHPAVDDLAMHDGRGEVSAVGWLPIAVARSMSTPHPPADGWGTRGLAPALTG